MDGRRELPGMDRGNFVHGGFPLSNLTLTTREWAECEAVAGPVTTAGFSRHGVCHRLQPVLREPNHAMDQPSFSRTHSLKRAERVFVVPHTTT
jgi:hypothetical protein